MVSVRKVDIHKLKYVLVPVSEWERLVLLDEKSRLTRADLARRYGCARSMFCRKPWLLPGCDIKSKGIRDYRWTREEVEDWERIPEKERRRMYERYTKEKEACI